MKYDIEKLLTALTGISVYSNPALPTKSIAVSKDIFELLKADGECTKSDANLIAAAPKMLEALQRQVANVERWLETGIPATEEESRSIVEQMQAAIAAALGHNATR